MTEILLLSATDVQKLVTMKDVMDAVEEVFRVFGLGSSEIAPVILRTAKKRGIGITVKMG